MARWFSWWTVASWHRKSMMSQLALLKYYHSEVLGKQGEDLPPAAFAELGQEGEGGPDAEVMDDPRTSEEHCGVRLLRVLYARYAPRSFEVSKDKIR